MGHRSPDAEERTSPADEEERTSPDVEERVPPPDELLPMGFASMARFTYV